MQFCIMHIAQHKNASYTEATRKSNIGQQLASQLAND